MVFLCIIYAWTFLRLVIIMLRLVIIMLRLEISKQFTPGSCNAWSTHLRLDQAKGVKFAYFATFYAWFPCHSTPGLLIWWKENIRLVYAVSDAWFTCCYQADNFVQVKRGCVRSFHEPQKQTESELKGLILIRLTTDPEKFQVTARKRGNNSLHNEINV